jgi:Caspase domain
MFPSIRQHPRRRMLRLVTAAAMCAALATEAAAERVQRRRALLIGINDYTASRLGPKKTATPRGRDWPNLSGAVNDVNALSEMLVALYDFDQRDIVTVTDQNATRAAILQALDRHLVQQAAAGDIIFFYFAGHGSQVRNTLSEEQDKLDESIVPADSRAGAADIRDKELLPIFNRILDRGARLTVMLDNCHSGSGARGLPTGALPRGVEPDLRDVADRTVNVRPEDRGALIVSAAQDFDKAWETRDPQGNHHGAFSWAWLRAMRDATDGEPAIDTFLRAQARLRGETPFQEPVLAGNNDVRHVPFLGNGSQKRRDRALIAIEKVKSDGTVLLQGGWANGLSIGSELRLANDGDVRLTVTAMHGLGRSSARMNGTLPPSIRAGALLEPAGWAVPPSRPLRVWMPRTTGDVPAIGKLARSMYTIVAQRNVRWVSDPIETTPTHLLRRGTRDWELLGPRGSLERLGDDAGALASISRLVAGSSLFVQFPAAAMLVEGIDLERDGIDVVERAEDADYILVGRFSSRKLGYAWVRPWVRKDDRRKTGLPLRTAWIVEEGRDNAVRDAAPELRDAVLRLRRIHSWHLLESPPDARWPYRLGIRRARNGEWVKTDDADSLIGDEKYDLFLRATPPLPPRVRQRHVYVFAIDSHGKSSLLFPRSGSVENRFPLTLTDKAPAEIPLGEAASFAAAPPYGVDTYFLLTTDEPLPNPWVLQWESVRAIGEEEDTPLAELLKLTAAGSRGRIMVTPRNWSLEKFALESRRVEKTSN